MIDIKIPRFIENMLDFKRWRLFLQIHISIIVGKNKNWNFFLIGKIQIIDCFLVLY